MGVGDHKPAFRHKNGTAFRGFRFSPRGLKTDETDKPDAIGEFYTSSDAARITPAFARRGPGAGLYQTIPRKRKKESERV
jgi:hypothetical protein